MICALYLISNFTYMNLRGSKSAIKKQAQAVVPALRGVVVAVALEQRQIQRCRNNDKEFLGFSMSLQSKKCIYLFISLFIMLSSNFMHFSLGPFCYTNLLAITFLRPFRHSHAFCFRCSFCFFKSSKTGLSRGSGLSCQRKNNQQKQQAELCVSTAQNQLSELSLSFFRSCLAQLSAWFLTLFSSLSSHLNPLCVRCITTKQESMR